MDVILTGVAWLHLTATVVILGYFAVVSLVVLPVLRRTLSADQLGGIVARIERRALPFVVVALAVLLATGVYLTGSDTRYGGVGSIGSPWAGVMLLKHGVIVVMLALGAWVDAVAVRVGSADGTEAARLLRRFAFGSTALTVLGLLVLLLTAIAQAG